MHTLRRALGIAVVCLGFSAQQPIQAIGSSGAQGDQAALILQQSIKSLTGGKSITDIDLEGAAQKRLDLHLELGTATLFAMRPGFSKVVVVLPSGTYTEIRNPSSMPMVGVIPQDAPASAQTAQLVGAASGPDGILHPVAEHNLLTDPTWFFPTFTLERLAGASGYLTNNLGLETLNGKQMIHLTAGLRAAESPNASSVMAMSPAQLSQTEIYLDPSSLLPATITFNTHPDSNALIDIPTEIDFSDYRNVGGAMVAFHVQEYQHLQLTFDLAVTSVKIDSGLADSDFRVQ